MSDILVTGSAGLIGSEAASFLCAQGHRVIGVDNNMRRIYFGEEGDTTWVKNRLMGEHKNYLHHDIDIRDTEKVRSIFTSFSFDLIIHAAAQPSHDWAARDPWTDFTVNANGTLNLLEHFRRHCPEAVFVFVSTNKVYGDRPNGLPLLEKETRYELPEEHFWYDGVDETMSIDQSLHSLFGASKLAADMLVQEYGRYFNLKTGVFRGGCLTGPYHSGTMMHGFLSYMMKCCISGKKYTIYGYQGKQVRDNIHAHDFVGAIMEYCKKPGYGEVYNMGGGRFCNCSLLEAMSLCEEISGHRLSHEYVEQARQGDHRWWISGTGKFRRHFPDWRPRYDLRAILQEIYDVQKAVV